MNRPFFAVSALFAAAMLAVGCSQPSMDPALVAAHRTKLTMAEEPDGAQTVLDVRRVMLGEEATEEHDHELAEGAEGEAAAEDDHSGETPEEHAAHAHEDETAHDNAEPKTPVLSEMDVVLVGAVGGVANPSPQSHPEFPFARRQALFFLADPEAAAEYEEHAHQHAPGEECAFCSAHAGEAAHLVAVVQFNDKAGKPLPVDARELFDLKEKETVVVRGKAKMTPTGMLTVEADGLYVRR